jgi:hypothetical protein
MVFNAEMNPGFRRLIAPEDYDRAAVICHFRRRAAALRAAGGRNPGSSIA